MKLPRLALFVVLAAPLLGSPGKLANLVLYQPDTVLKERLGPDANPLALYAVQLQAKIGSLAESPVPELLDIVVVVKPGRQSRVWLVSSLASPPDRSALKHELEALPPVEVKNGPVIFALSYTFNNAEPKKTGAAGYQPPLPTEWQEKGKGATGPLIVPDGFMPLVWPDEEKASAPAANRNAALATSPGSAGAQKKALVLVGKPNPGAIGAGVPFPNLEDRPAELRPGVLPQRVRYKFALDDSMTVGAEHLKQHLLADPVSADPLFREFVMIQPGAWKWLKPAGALGLKASQKLETMFPERGKMVRFEGAILRDPGELAALERLLRELIRKDGGGRIRALKSAEMGKWWTYIGFDIEEPTLVIETVGRKYLFIIGFSGGRVLIVDELNGLP